MFTEKKMLSLAVIEDQTSLALPDRELLHASNASTTHVNGTDVANTTCAKAIQDATKDSVKVSFAQSSALCAAFAKELAGPTIGQPYTIVI